MADQDIPPQALLAREMRLVQRMTFGAIAKELHLTEYKILTWAKKYGFHDPLNQEDREQALIARELRLVQRMTYTAIAEKLGRTEHRIIVWAKKYGFHDKLDLKYHTKHGQDFDDKLRKLWAADVSAAAIGLRLGVSKNAIIGRKRRLHLPDRPSPLIPQPSSKPRKRRRRFSLPATAGTVPPLPSGEAGGPLTPMACMPHQEIRQTAPAPSLAPTSAMPTNSLSIRECCYPIGERPIRYCDAPVLRYRRSSGVMVSRSYCAKHYALAYDRYDPEMPLDVARRIVALLMCSKAAA